MAYISKPFSTAPVKPHSTMPENNTIRLRPIEASDEDFLLRLYASTREAELALVPWDDAQKAAFARFQYLAQLAHYQSEYPAATQQLVLFDEQPAGRLYLHRRAHEWRILDYTLAPEQREHPAGAQLIRTLMDEAAAAGLPLNTHLEPGNWAFDLFAQLGFAPTTHTDAHVLYEWRAPQ
mgnify:CR=1 FL=1